MSLISSVKGGGVLIVFHLTIVAIFCIKYHDEICPNEFSTIPYTKQNISWQSTGTNNEIILSDPPCVDEFGNLIVRVCSNGTWIPKLLPTCMKAVELSRKCPPNFQETERSCIFISEPMPWKANCDAITGLRSSIILQNETIWLPFRRSSKYGPFESVTWGQSFGIPLENKLKFSMKYEPFDKNCLVLNTNTIELENCDNLHKHICEFPKNERYKCPTNCVNAAINSNDCYCKVKKECKSLVDIRSLFQKNVLSDLAGNDSCFVGGRKLLTGYSQSLSKYSWLYTREQLNCSLCHSELQVRQKENVYMVLNFEAEKKNLFLVIYNPDELYDNGAENTIYCFTNASPNDLRKRMDVKQIAEQYATKSPFKVYEVEMEIHIGQYSCQAYDKYDSDEVVQSNKIIGYNEKPGNEYALRILINNVCDMFNCTDEIPVVYQDFFHNNLSSELNSEVRVMEIFTFDMQILDILLHISTRHKNPVNSEYNTLKEKLESTLEDTDIVYFRNSEFCLPEWTFSDTGTKMFWTLTPIGHNAVPKPFCLQEDGLPVFRRCEGNFLNGAEWSSIVGKCDDNLEPPQSATFLQSVLNETITNRTINEVTKIITGEPNLPVLSVYFVAKILERISLAHHTVTSDVNIPDEPSCTLDITDSLMNVERNSLAKAQDMLNITDDILDTINDLLCTSKLDSNVLVIQRNNVVLHSTNPFLSNISGVAVYSDDVKGITLRSLRRNESFETVQYDDNFKMAYYVPEDILEYFKDGNLTIITTIFFNDRLFVSDYAKKPTDIVLSITIPDRGIFLPSTIPILFKSHGSDGAPECGFWDYGKKSERKKGRWSTIGGNYMENFENETKFHLCSFSHLTHFALLMFESTGVDKDDYDPILSIITYIGDFLSLLGLFGIFLTAILYKKWRRKQGTIILLNLSAAIIMEIVLVEMIEKSPITSASCVIFGQIVHYTFISKFSWMLIYSFLQYVRFVKVFTVLPDNIVWLSIIFGWGFAIIPVVIVALVDPHTYVMEKYNFCYPSGLSLYLGVLMPVLIIIFINTFVFFSIMREVTTKTVESHGNKDKALQLQIQLASLLFFILGVPWLFGVFRYVIPIAWIQKILLYLFCITTNVQGFILFVFYVVFNGETRNFWYKYFTRKETFHISISAKTSERF